MAQHRYNKNDKALSKTGETVSSPCQKEDIIGLLIKGQDEMQKKIDQIYSSINKIQIDLSGINTVMSKVVVTKIEGHDKALAKLEKDFQSLKEFKVKAVFWIAVFSTVGGFLFSIVKDKLADLIK
jgi:hypothetical protein